MHGTLGRSKKNKQRTPSTGFGSRPAGPAGHDRRPRAGCWGIASTGLPRGLLRRPAEPARSLNPAPRAWIYMRSGAATGGWKLPHVAVRCSSQCCNYNIRRRAAVLMGARDVNGSDALTHIYICMHIYGHGHCHIHAPGVPRGFPPPPRRPAGGPTQAAASHHGRRLRGGAGFSGRRQIARRLPYSLRWLHCFQHRTALINA